MPERAVGVELREALQFERGQQAMRGGHRQAAEPREVADPESVVMLAEMAQQAQRAGDGLHAFGFVRAHFGIPFHTVENIFPFVTASRPLR